MTTNDRRYLYDLKQQGIVFLQRLDSIQPVTLEEINSLVNTVFKSTVRGLKRQVRRRNSEAKAA